MNLLLAECDADDMKHFGNELRTAARSTSPGSCAAVGLLLQEMLHGLGIGRGWTAGKGEGGQTVAIAGQLIAPENLTTRQVQRVKLTFTVGKNAFAIIEECHEIMPHSAWKRGGPNLLASGSRGRRDPSLQSQQENVFFIHTLEVD